jgi:hypothetical protein
MLRRNDSPFRFSDGRFCAQPEFHRTFCQTEISGKQLATFQ